MLSRHAQTVALLPMYNLSMHAQGITMSCLVVQGDIYLQFDMTMNLQAVENDDSQGGERILYVLKCMYIYKQQATVL